MTASSADRQLSWAPWWVLAFVALWPLPGIAEGVLALGSLLAMAVLLVRRFRGGIALLSHEAWALTTVLFFSYWLPELVSSFDAVNTRRAFGESLLDLRYLPFLWLVAIAVANDSGRRRTFVGLAVIGGAWTLDALWQAASGHSLLFDGLEQLKLAFGGKRLCDPREVVVLDRLSGVLGPCNLKLGQVLASVSPFVIFAVARRFGTLGWWISAATIGLVLLLAGSRAAWITYALVLVLTGWRLIGWKRLLVAFAGGVLVLVALAYASPQVAERLERTTQALNADEAGVDEALSGRARVWQSAWCMVREHPFNGVGARGFRRAFRDCDPEAGQQAEWGRGPALHAHQLLLEVLSETGVIGLLMWLAGIALAWRAWRYADAQARDRARPAMIALAVTVFPLNTHLAFYSTFWGGVTLLLVALYSGSLLATAPPPPPARAAD